MSDERVRSLERRAVDGDVAAKTELAAALVRRGLCPWCRKPCLTMCCCVDCMFSEREAGRREPAEVCEACPRKRERDRSLAKFLRRFGVG